MLFWSVSTTHQSEIKQLHLATNCKVYYYLSSFRFGAATNSHFHTVGNDSHLLSLNGLCVCLSAPVNGNDWVKNPKVTRGWIVTLYASWRMGQSPTYMVKVIIPSRHISMVELFRVLTWEEKKRFTCTSIRRMHHQPWQFNKFSTKSDTTGWWLLLRHLICSTAHISTTLGNRPKYIGVRDKVHASSPPNPLKLFSSAPNSRYSSLRETYCRWIPGSMCYQSESLPLSPSSLPN